MKPAAYRRNSRLPRAVRLGLTWRFAIAAFITMVVIGVVIQKLLSQAITEETIADVKAEARDTVARRVLNHLAPSDLAAPMSGERLAEFEHFVQESVLSGRTAHVVVWNRDGVVIYSDDASLIGQVPGIDDVRAQALAGKTVSDLPGHAEVDDVGRRNDQVIEVYTPLVFPGAREPAGIFEIYQTSAPMTGTIAALRNHVVLAVSGGLAILYLLLLGIVHGAARTIRRQNRDLEKAFREHILAEAARAQLAGIVEGTPDIVATTDIEGRMRYLNQAGRRVLGLRSDEDLSGRNILDFSPPSIRESLEQKALPCAAATGSWTGESAMVAEDGSEIVLSQVIIFHKGEHESGAFLSTIARDISERKRLEDALRESEDRYRLLVDESPYAIAVHQDGQFVFINRAGMSLLAATGADELLGRPIHTVLHADWWEMAQKRTERVVQGETALYHGEVQLIRLDGREVPVELTAAPFRFRGRPAIQLIAIDVTERALAQQRLRESEALYRSILDCSPDAVAITDIEGRVVVCSPAALAMFGADTIADLAGRTVTEFVVPEDRDRARANISHMYERSQDWSERSPDEYRVARADGAVFDVEVMGDFIREAAGGPTGMIFDVRDVTARKRAEEAMARLAAIVESSNDAILMLAPDRSVLSWNQAAEDLYGWPAAEAIGRSLFELISTPPQLLEAQREILEGAFAGKAMSGYDTVRVGRHGKRVDVALTVFPIRDTSGAVVAVGGIHRNIGERKRAEERLRESEERFRATFEQAAVGVAHVGLDGRWLRVNQKLCDIVGYAREELLEKRFQDITHPDDVELDLDAMRGLVTGEIEPVSTEKRYLRKDGSLVWVDRSLSLVRARPGKRDYFISVVEDISARKQAEQAMELQSAALSAAADAIVITDSTGAIEWVNPAFSALTGYAAAEAIGKNPWELLKSDVQDQAFYRDLRDTILAGNVWQGSLTNRRKDGGLYTEEQSITPVKDPGGAITHFIAVKRDITERKRLEAQFLQSQKMQSVGQLAGGIAHDFNNLLNVINGTTLLVSEQLRAGDPLREDLQEITRAADQAAAMTRQLLAFSRKQIMQPKVLDLTMLIRQLEGMLRRLIGEDVDLVVVPAKGSCSVRADPVQIEQVVMNLAVNARDAMPGGGTLAIATEAVEFDEANPAAVPPVQPGRYVALTISDTGVGMDPATRARIFEPFFTTKEVGRGTGLGLSTVIGIVSQSGGGVEVVSEPCRGTTFQVYLPWVEEAVAGTDQLAPTITPARGAETILVVEDYSGLRLLARRMLEKEGYTVLVSGNGAEALRLLDSHGAPVHLLLTDVVMPGMDGRELATRVVAAHPATRVIFTSGYTGDAVMRYGVHAEAAHFLAKPYTKETLTIAVRKALDTPGRQAARALEIMPCGRVIRPLRAPACTPLAPRWLRAQPDDLQPFRHAPVENA